MGITVKSQILDVEPYIPGKPIQEVKRELGLKEVVKLASNESPFRPSFKVLEAIRKEAQNVNRYPDGGCFYLRQALSQKLKVKPQQLIFGNGSDEIIVMAIRALIKEGDEVIVAKPSFLIYEIASRLEGASVQAIPLKDFHYDLPSMLSAISPKTKIIFIGNPDNPAGTYVTAKEIEDFMRAVPKDILIFIDEAYFEFISAKDYPDTIALLKSNENLIVSRTFSKMYGLAGLRVGYAVGESRFIDALNRLREPFNINSLAQAGALACLEDGAYYRRVAKFVNAEKKFLYRELKRMGFKFQKSATNFILIDTERDSSGVCEALLKKGIIIRDMNFWGLKNYVRVTVGKKAENRKLLKALNAVLGG